MSRCARAVLALLFGVAACDSSATAPAAEPSKPKPAPEPAAAAEPADDAPVDISPAQPPAGTWIEFSSEDDRFEARFPAAPQKEVFMTPSPAGELPTTMYMAEKGDQFLGLGVVSVPKEFLAEFDVQGALDGGRDGMVNNVGGKLVSEKQMKFVGHDARAIIATASADGLDVKIEARLLYVEPRLYQLLVIVPSTATASPAGQFFESFALLEGDG